MGEIEATYEVTRLVNQAHLMCKLVCIQLDESKSAVEHLFAFTSTQNCRTLDYLPLMISLRPPSS